MVDSARTGITLIGTPYSTGERGVRMGRGPLEVLADGADAVPARVRAFESDVEVKWVDKDEPEGHDVRLPPFEPMSRVIVQNWEVQRLVREALDASRIPVLSSGNCATSLGVVGGIDDESIGVIWLDAHADNSTPDDSPSGLFDGMPVSVINGRSWKKMAQDIPGFHTVPAERFISVGMHGALPDRPAPLGRVVNRAAADAVGGWAEALDAALQDLRQRTSAVYLHVDTDVTDPEYGAVSPYTAPGGLSPDEVLFTIEQIVRLFDVRAINFTAFDPDADERALPMVRGYVVKAAELLAKKEKGEL